MARILLCHVPKDGSAARDLGAALMGRGHTVSFDGEPDAPRADRMSRLRQFEAVIVLWTEGSAQSPGLLEIARVTMPLNLLVSVRSDQVSVARLPLIFRKLHMLSPRDIDGIARLAARLSTAAVSLREIAEQEVQRKSAAAPPPSPLASAALPPPLSFQPGRESRPERWPHEQPVVAPKSAVRARPLADLPEVDIAQRSAAGGEGRRLEPVLPSPPVRGSSPGEWEHDDRQMSAATAVMTAADLAAAVEAGLLVSHIPAAMWLGIPATVELTLGRDVLAALAGGQSIETLSVSLYGSAEAFEIERQSERTQFVAVRQGEPGRDPSAYGRWTWLVTPRAVGAQDLVVRVGALLRDRKGVPGPVALPDRRFTIAIALPEGRNPISALAGWRPR